MFRFGLRSLLIAISLLCAYLGTYSALLQPVVLVDEGTHGMVIDGYRQPHFTIGGDAAKFVFSPAVWLDRTIRPTYWDHFSDYDTFTAEETQK